MITPGPRHILDRGFIVLDDWALAPLSLNDGTNFYAIFEKPYEGIKRTEIILTTFPPDVWDDLWRIEIETRDTIGNLYLLLDLLARKGIDVLASEGSANTFGEKHTMSFIASCKHYGPKQGSIRDLDGPRRLALDNVSLRDLALAIRVNFLGQLTRDNERRARIKIKRLDLFRQLHFDLQYKKSRLINGSPGSVLESHKFAIDPTNLKIIQKHFSAPILYTPDVDSKNRVIRVLLFSYGERMLGHLQFYVPVDATEVMRQIFNILYSHNANTIKHQMRLGANRIIKKEFSEGQPSVRPARLDVTFECANKEKSIFVLTDEIKNAIVADKFLSERGVKVLHSNNDIGRQRGAKR